jgi:F-box associated protein
MASSIEDSSEHLRQVIDDELESLEKTARALKLRRNALAPISCLPPETIAIIFSFLSLPKEYVRLLTGDKQDNLAWLRVSHVCHRWREIALNQPRFWSRIDFTTLTSAGVTEVLSRSKMAPLELEANLSCVHWGGDRVDAFGKQLFSHVSHISRLTVTADFVDLQTIIEQLASPAPALDWLSLTVEDKCHLHMGIPANAIIPHSLFDGTVPRLSRLYLDHCDISWTSPLFKSLRILELQTLSPHARPILDEWLDTLEQMLQLETLVVNHATPRAPPVGTPLSEPTRVITHPSLTQLNLAASASDCTFALSHLVLPALIRIRVDVTSELASADDVRALIPHFSRNAHGSQDAEPLQSILLSGEPSLTEVVVWTAAGADMEVLNPVSLIGATLSARAIFTASGSVWRFGKEAEILDSTLGALPLGSLNTLTAQNSSKIPERLWFAHAPRWPLLERVRLIGTVAKSFTTVLAKDTPSEGPLLPSLTKISLFNTLHTDDTSHLLDMLTERVEQGVPLDTLDLRACEVTDHAVQLFSEVVIDVQRPDVGFRSTGWWPTLSNWSRDMGLLLFHRDFDEYEGSDEEDTFSDDDLLLHHPWFPEGVAMLDDSEDGEEVGDEELGGWW